MEAMSESTTSRSSFRSSPRRRPSFDSPSRQLHDEVFRWHMESDRRFQARLDQEAKDLEERHRKALDKAKKKHDAVVQRAERERDLLHLRIEQDNVRRERESVEELEQARREKEALENDLRERKHNLALQHQREAQERIERDRRIAEAEARARAENERLATVRQQRAESLAQEQQAAEARRKQQEAEDDARMKAQEAARVASEAPAVQPPAAQISAPISSNISQSTPLMQWNQLEAEHAQYLTLHKKLKSMRRDMLQKYKQVRTNKSSQLSQLAEMRRELQKTLGQTTDDSQKNRQIRNQVQEIMRRAWNITEVVLDAREYIIRLEMPWPAGVSTQVSGAFIYLLNTLTKSAMAQMNASSRQTAFNAVDYYGVILSWIASHTEFRLHGNSFADVIIAKFHHSCPPLFGVFGPDNTLAGRQRLGWQATLNSQEHFDRVNALSIGWAALTMRDYTKVRSQGLHSAIPQWHYWRSLACILNVPPQQLTKTHAIALKGLLDRYANHFIKFYGYAAKALLRRAIIELPSSAAAGTGFEAVGVLKDTLEQRFGLRL